MTNSYIIGTCQYNSDTGELTHPDKEAPWRLPRVEKQLLERLLQQRGEALTKQQLRLDEQQQPAFSDSAVVKGIFTLRHYIDDEQHLTLQTVTGVGYSLAASPKAVSQPQGFVSQYFSRFIAIVAAITAVAIGLMWYNSTSLAALKQQAYQHTNQLVGSSEHPIKVNIISNSKANREALKIYQQRLTLNLQSCPNANWDRAYIALSHDDMILNITMLADHPQHTQLRNIKISDFRLHGEFLNQRWLEEADLCG